MIIPISINDLADFFRYHARYVPLDSVNLLFEKGESAMTTEELLAQVVTVLQGDGWGRGLQERLYLLCDNYTLMTEAAHRVKPPGLHPFPRYHVRLWSQSDSVFGAAHYEQLSGFGHAVTSFDDGRDEVERAFSAARWKIQPGGQRLQHTILAPACDGSITVIVPP